VIRRSCSNGRMCQCCDVVYRDSRRSRNRGRGRFLSAERGVDDEALVVGMNAAEVFSFAGSVCQGLHSYVYGL
jgi:hypothetical protein